MAPKSAFLWEPKIRRTFAPSKRNSNIKQIRIMKQIETIKAGKNFSAVSVGKVNEIIEHELPMGAVTI